MFSSQILSKSATLSGCGSGSEDTLFHSSAASGEEKYIYFPKTATNYCRRLAASPSHPHFPARVARESTHMAQCSSRRREASSLLPREPQFAFHRRKKLPGWDRVTGIVRLGPNSQILRLAKQRKTRAACTSVLAPPRR